ncbi:MAG: nitroreductase family protein [Deltaproteobacteria bacterium]|nr:nitroreductase family protein [Deltaproteobacteria bacterium]MBW2136237.1 nitroreductase family protein [Deltaproteobacteria bacterium]
MNYEEFIDLLQKRRSVRRYKPDPVPREALEKILEACRYTPSAGNSQPWEFILVQDPETKKGLSKRIALEIREEVKKDPDIARGIAVQPFLYTAPVLIVVCGDRRLKEAYPAWMDRYALLRQSLSNCILSIQLAAACFGLATAWATIQSGPTEKVVRDMLGIPEAFTVDHIIPVGYPDEEAEDKQSTLRTVKERARFSRDLKDILHKEHYDPAKFRSDEDIKAFLRERTITRIPKT